MQLYRKIYLEFNHSISGWDKIFLFDAVKAVFDVVNRFIKFSSLSFRFLSIFANMDIINRSVPFKSFKGKQSP